MFVGAMFFFEGVIGLGGSGFGGLSLGSLGWPSLLTGSGSYCWSVSSWLDGARSRTKSNGAREATTAYLPVQSQEMQHELA